MPKEPSLDEKLKQEYDRWNYLYIHGGQDPFWSDGCALELVRNHIMHIKRQMEEAEQITDTYYREIPVEVDRTYMARADEIRTNAKKSLDKYKKNGDYLYLLDVIGLLNKRQIEDTCISNVIGYVRGLEQFIKDDDLVSMRRHENPDRYIDSFKGCRKKVNEILGEKPKIVFYQDTKQLQGQITINDFL